MLGGRGGVWVPEQRSPASPQGKEASVLLGFVARVRPASSLQGRGWSAPAGAGPASLSPTCIQKPRGRSWATWRSAAGVAATVWGESLPQWGVGTRPLFGGGLSSGGGGCALSCLLRVEASRIGGQDGFRKRRGLLCGGGRS